MYNITYPKSVGPFEAILCLKDNISSVWSKYHIVHSDFAKLSTTITQNDCSVARLLLCFNFEVGLVSLLHSKAPYNERFS